MSPTLLAKLRHIELRMRRNNSHVLNTYGPDPMGAIYPRDFHRAYVLVQQGWNY